MTSFPQLFSWTVIQRGDPPHLGALGICDDQQRALTRLSEALQSAPAGAQGIVHKVVVSLAEVGYWYGPPIITAEVDAVTGDVVLTEAESPGGWDHLNGILREAVRRDQ
ncbi:MAG: hypothetical protein JWL97_4171 [Gemmatimonadales bacterium]|jgi:hypothetical protein|nr:hypothetical protein [Gemmatimonadales bacterium]